MILTCVLRSKFDLSFKDIDVILFDVLFLHPPSFHSTHIFWLLFNIILAGSDWVCLLLVQLRITWERWSVSETVDFFVHAFFLAWDFFHFVLLLAGHWHQITFQLPHLSFWVNDITCGPNRSEAFQCFFFGDPKSTFILQSLNTYIGSMFTVIVVS